MGSGGLGRGRSRRAFGEKWSREKEPLWKYLRRVLRSPRNPRHMAQKLLVECELPVSEISARTRLSPGNINTIRYRLREAGVPTRIPGTMVSAMAVARTLVRQEVLMQLSNGSFSKCMPAAETELKGATMKAWEKYNPAIFSDTRAFRKGRLWRKAHGQLAGWIAEQEARYGGKYNPGVHKLEEWENRPGKKEKTKSAPKAG